MKIRIWSSYEEYEKTFSNFQRWFAWHPIMIDGELVWFQHVYRIRKICHSIDGVCDWWEYSLTPKKDKQ